MMRRRLAIVGAGVTGTALAYLAAEYTDLEVVLIEKYDAAAPLNSSARSNSQTLHFGRIETNLGLKAALAARRASEMVRRFALKHGLLGDVILRGQEMQLAVGEEEIRKTRVRFLAIKPYYPELRFLPDARAVGEDEPAVVLGRNEPVAAIFSDEGYAADFGRLSQAFIALARRSGRLRTLFGTAVTGARREGERWIIETSKGDVDADFVVFAAGAHSLNFAKRLGVPEARHLSVLPVAGDFFWARRNGRGLLRGKVYTMQDERLPFAAVHGDPDLTVDATRLGPTARVLPMLERRNPSSVLDFIRSALGPGIARTLVEILKDETQRNFIARNAVYRLPLLGRLLYLLFEARKVIPSLKLAEIEFAEGVGGIRPQVVDTRARKLVKGEVKLSSGNAILNMTPSPGATKCLASAAEDLERIAEALGVEVRWDEFDRDFPVDADVVKTPTTSTAEAPPEEVWLW